MKNKAMDISGHNMLKNDNGFALKNAAICLATVGFFGVLFSPYIKPFFNERAVKKRADYPAVVAFHSCAERLLKNGKGEAFKHLQGAEVTLLPFGDISQVNVAETSWFENKSGVIIEWGRGKVFKYEKDRYNIVNFKELDAAPYRDAINGLSQCHSDYYLTNLPKPRGAGN